LLIGGGGSGAEKLRTAQFLNSARKCGEVFLVEILPGKFPAKIDGNSARIGAKNWNRNFFVKKIYRKFRSEICVGVNFVGAQTATEILPKFCRPFFWADFNGWPSAEVQIQSRHFRSNGFLPRLFSRERKILRAADKFSTVSNRQKFATLGLLAAAGRLRFENWKFNFVETIENLPMNFPEKNKNSAPIFRNKIPRDAFVFGQLGGFNSWLDEKTLFESLENSIAENPRIFFATTGGAIEKIDEKTFQEFGARVAKSEFRKHFIFTDRLKSEQIPQFYNEIDAVLNCDFLCAETATGARNRLTEAVNLQIPIVSTGGSEIAEKIGKFGAGLICKNENPREITTAILKLSTDENLRREMKTAAKKFAAREFSPAKMRSFENWLKKPTVPNSRKNLNLNFANFPRAVWAVLRKKFF
jgi:glycosyltransferase involved in cell wall biosynthesis